MRKVTAVNTRVMLLCISAAYIVLSFVLLCNSKISMQNVCSVLGMILLAMGAVSIVWYFLKKEYLDPSRFGFAIGIGEGMLGCFALLRGEMGAVVILQILAFCILLDSLLKLQYSMNLLQMRFHFWWIALLLSFVTIGLGMTALTYPFGDETFHAKFTYISLILDAVINVIVVLFQRVAQKRIEKALPAELPKEENDCAEDGTTKE